MHLEFDLLAEFAREVSYDAGQLLQALPIGCIRVFMTPSCSSAVTLDNRCSGTLNSLSSWRRLISSSWLRVNTSSDTIVIRCSSVSTLTRMDWLAIRSPSGASSTFFGSLCDWLGATGTADTSGAGSEAGAVSSTFVSRNARSDHQATLRRGTEVVREVVGERPAVSSADMGSDGSGADLDGPCSAMRCNASIRSGSSPSGSVSDASSWPKMSLMRSIVVRISVTASPVTGMPSRNLPISVSAACASASSLGNPRKPQVPLMVWTGRKMLCKISHCSGPARNGRTGCRPCRDSRWFQSRIPEEDHPCLLAFETPRRRRRAFHGRASFNAKR